MKRIAFDIGASHMRIGEMAEDTIIHVRHTNTPQDPDEAVAAFKQLAGDTPVDEAYGGIPAIVQSDGSAREATNLPAWNGFPFADSLAQALGARIYVRNDAELAALGEATYGTGKGMGVVAYIGLGTGVGTACVRNGVVLPHTSEGEGRRTVLTLSDGSWLEDHIGGRSIATRYGVSPTTLGREVWTELTPFLIEGIQNALTLWNPDVVVLGGSLMNESTGFSLSEIQRMHISSVPIRLAEQGDEAGLYGALAWAQQESAA